ncbi:MAG: histidine triad nucleotide-binding protein [Oscillospiraceae bacterium]|nr:histidine triad nucleotide-binding protein [Oscillospiraceae bacterium]
MDCLFCKIVAGEIPSAKVYEDEWVYAFKDISPIAPVHYLFIPKEHLSGASAVNEENAAIVGKIFTAIAKVAAQEGLASGYRVITNCGEDAGQTVPHLHFHLLAGTKMGWSSESGV